MKNSLELQIYDLIKKANQHYVQQELDISLNIYQKALVVFRENRNYNSQVSPHFQPLLCSLMGLACLKSNEYGQAQHFLSKSLQFNHHDSLTLIRRAQLYCQMKRIPQALQDVQKAHICDPDSKNVKFILNLIEQKISQFENHEEKERLSKKLQDINKYIEQSLQNGQGEEQINLSFLNLRKIDRTSTTVTSNKLVKKISLFHIQNQTDKCEQVLNDQVSKQQQDQSNANPITIIKKFAVKKKSTIGGSSFSSLAQNQNIEGPTEKSSGNGCNSSIKSIENKIIRRSSVQFLEPSTFEELPQKTSTSTQNLTQRKSCLRISKLKIQQVQPRKTSSFMNITNIDGISKQLMEQMKQKQQKSFSKQRKQLQFSDSDKEEENSNQHCIYGTKSKTTKALQSIENMSSWSNRPKKASKCQKKNSILKKNSVICSQKQTNLRENKKSVCFQGEHMMVIENKI